MLIEVSLAISVLLFFYHCFPRGAPHNLPRVGPPTLFGYLWTAFRFTFNHPELIEEGLKQFSGQPFLLPTLSGSIVIIGAENIEFLRNCDDSIFSYPAFIEEFLQLHHTLDDGASEHSYHATVARTDLARAIPRLIPTQFEEMVLVFENALKLSKESEPISFPVIETILPMIGCITNCAMVGQDLCRNPSYVQAVSNCAKSVFMYSRVLRWCPATLRGVVYFILSSLFGGKKDALTYLEPFMTEYITNRNKQDEVPPITAEFLYLAAPPEHVANPHHLAMRILYLNFAGVHSSALFLSFALFKLASIRESQREEIREEIRETLIVNDGWNKASLDGFRKLDSCLREVGRFYVGQIGLLRWTVKDGILPDGTVIPAGHMVAVNIHSAHRDPIVYPDPDVFDPFRFSKLCDEEGSGLKHRFASVDKNYLLWGIGRHACGGRLFSAMLLKMVMAYILINYEFSFPPGVTEPPKSFFLEGIRIPDVTARLMFRKASV